jgi:hypothetical protein
VVVSAPEVLPPAPQALPPAWAEVAWCAAGRATVCTERAVAPALEPSRTLPLGRYHLHYCRPLEPVDGSEVSPLDWSV